MIFCTFAHADPYKFAYAALHDLPGPVQKVYRNEKPHLGDMGRCAVSFDSSMGQEIMFSPAPFMSRCLRLLNAKPWNVANNCEQDAASKRPARLFQNKATSLEGLEHL